jgi:starch-binding outer membrane protein SusE/F
MKKLFKNLLALILTIAVFSSCKKDENQVAFSGGDNPVLTVNSTAAQTLLIANATQTAVSFNWTNPNYKFNTGVSSQDVTYTLQVDTMGANFTNPKIGERTISKDLSTSFTVKELNTLLLGMGLLENMPHTMEMRIKSTLANGSVPLYSNVIKKVITPYLDVVYPVPAKLYITGSASPASWMGGGDPENVAQRFTKVSSSKFELTIALSANNSYLFVPVYGDWSNKYGFTGSNNNNGTNGDTFKPDGGDMKAPASSGTYKITVDFKTGKWSVQ